MQTSMFLEVPPCLPSPSGEKAVARVTFQLDAVSQVTLRVRMPSWKADGGEAPGVKSNES